MLIFSGSPSPRKLIPASVRMAWQIDRGTTEKMVGITAGKRCFLPTQLELAPREIAAIKYSLLFRLRTSERTIR